MDIVLAVATLSSITIASQYAMFLSQYNPVLFLLLFEDARAFLDEIFLYQSLMICRK